MSKYEIDQKFSTGGGEDVLEREVVETLWGLFVAICERWDNVPRPDQMKTRFEAFLSNRIETDSRYTQVYRAARITISDLIKARGRDAAYEFLLNNKPADGNNPDATLEMVRRQVKNEFITLQISLGGFRSFTGAINYPGYIAGVNGNGPAPYRTAKKS